MVPVGAGRGTVPGVTASGDAIRAALDGTPGTLSGTERAVLGAGSPAEVFSLFDAHTRDRLGRSISAVRFRAGRIDVVWGLRLDDGRDVVVKAHRHPVDVRAVTAATRAKSSLVAAGFPCPRPLSGPDEVDGHVLVVETLLSAGTEPGGRDPGVRRLLAEGLAEHVAVLRRTGADDDLVARAGAGPSWCRYQQGPWPTPHDPVVDFTCCPPGYEWLDAFARRAGEQISAHRGHEVVVGHADWYAGNVAVADGELVGTFDWELVADTEAVVAGFAAAGFASSSTTGGGLSTPEEALGFLQDYERAREVPFDGAEQRAAAAAAGWIVAFNARWETAMRPGLGDGATTASLRARGEDHLSLTW